MRHVAMWQLDELAHDGAEHLDPDYVAGFDEKSRIDWSDDIAALQAFGIGAASTLVDFGAGTGSFAEAIGPHVGPVGVDVSEPVVAATARELAENVPDEHLTYTWLLDRPASSSASAGTARRASTPRTRASGASGEP